MEDLTELEMRILSELEEAGEEELQTMALTVMAGLAGNNPILEFQAALRRLAERDLLRMSTARDATGRLVDLSLQDSVSEVDRIGEVLTFDPSTGAWEDRRMTQGAIEERFPFIVDTPSGAKMAEGILESRGYQWWREHWWRED